MRVFVLILTLLCLAASPALAQDNGQGNGNGRGNGNANGNDNGRENGNGGGNNGNGNGPDQNSGNGNSQSNGNGNSQGNANAGNGGNDGNNGNGQGSGNVSTGTSANTDAGGTVHYSQDYARDVVNAGRAVSLASLMPELQARSEGSVIDAELLKVQGILVYSVKVLRTDGRVTQEYYYAQSGRFIGSEP